MSIREVTMYTVCCDRCGVSADQDTEYLAWSDRDSAALIAEEYGWHKIDSGTYCFECTEYDEDTDDYKVKVGTS